MVMTPSTMMPLGAPAPDFQLPDTVSGDTYTLADIRGDVATVVMFICNHCPFVVHVRDQLVSLANDYQNKGIGFIAISSNDVDNYPDDAPDKMAQLARQLRFPFPYCYDETQAVAKAYDAACTPDFFIFDNKLECAYRGQLDDSRPGNDRPVTGHDIRHALDQLLAGDAVDTDQKPSMGCNIKWK